MRFLGKSNKFLAGTFMNGKPIADVAEPVKTNEGATRKTVDDKILYSAVASKPATLKPGQLWAGY